MGGWFLLISFAANRVRFSFLSFFFFSSDWFFVDKLVIQLQVHQLKYFFGFSRLKSLYLSILSS